MTKRVFERLKQYLYIKTNYEVKRLTTYYSFTIRHCNGFPLRYLSDIISCEFQEDSIIVKYKWRKWHPNGKSIQYIDTATIPRKYIETIEYWLK